MPSLPLDDAESLDQDAELREPREECDASPVPLVQSANRLVRVMEPSAGAMVTDNVRLVSQIAEGGMGSVWLARHLGLDLPVAVKFMTPSAFRSTPAAGERFTREARIAAQVHHPNVVQILDFGCSPHGGGTPYIVMEHLEGEDLECYLGQHGCLDPEDVVSIVRTVASVLEKAHELGIVHRDIKPENVFLQGPDRIVKVLDFGVAKDKKERSNRTTENGEMLGTPFFMSPEQFVNPRDVDRRCDLWALAVLAYEALLGRMPFHGETPTAVFLAATRGHYDTPSLARRGLPRTVDSWFRTAFAADPAQRFSSAKVMAEAFARAIAGRPLVASHESAPPRRDARLTYTRRKWDRRGAALSVAFVAAAVAVGAFFFGRSPVEASSNALAPAPSAPASPIRQTAEAAEAIGLADTAGPTGAADSSVPSETTAPAATDTPERVVLRQPSPHARAASTRSETVLRRPPRPAPSPGTPSLFFRR